jgi:hypothetical protein
MLLDRKKATEMKLGSESGAYFEETDSVMHMMKVRVCTLFSTNRYRE